MGTFRTVWVGALAALAAMVVVAPASADVTIGLVDTVEVMNNYQRTKDASEDLQVEQANLKAASEPKVKRIEELRLQRDGFNKGSEEWKRLDDQALKAEVEFATWLRYEQAKIERRHRDVMIEMYREIQDVVKRIADEKQLHIVFTKAFLSPPQIDIDQAGNLEDLKQRIVAQRILFPMPPVEITEDVLKALNDKYEASKKAAGAEQPKG